MVSFGKIIACMSFLFVAAVIQIAIASPAKSKMQQIIFEDQRIEGKIRRPQLVLIRADERPQFRPMVLQSIGSEHINLGTLNDEIINASPNKRAFRFEGTRITNYAQ